MEDSIVEESTVTLQMVLLIPSEDVAIISASPAPVAVTLPPLTVATELSLVDHVIPVFGRGQEALSTLPSVAVSPVHISRSALSRNTPATG